MGRTMLFLVGIGSFVLGNGNSFELMKTHPHSVDLLRAAGSSDSASRPSAGSSQRAAAPKLLHTIVTDFGLGGHKMVELLEDESGDVVSCNTVGSRWIIDGVVSVIPKRLVIEVSEKEIQPLVDMCSNGDILTVTELSEPEGGRIGSFFNWLTIFPGTKWCGAGNIAKDFNDLGRLKGTDACCRDHDHSSDSIPAHGEKHGLKNPLRYTITHCRDDHRFYNCLLKDGGISAKAVGRAYFSVLRTPCFAFDHPMKCTLMDSKGKCEEFVKDKNQPKEWRIFPAKDILKDFKEGKVPGED